MRLHAITTTFVPNDSNQLARQLHGMLESSEYFNANFVFENQRSIYMSNKRVADEIRYVFERK